MNKLEQLLDKLESTIPQLEYLNPAISKAAVGWHIEHSLLTLDVVTGALKKSDPAAYKWKFNLVRMVVFITKKIPRGKAKSPDVVIPKGSLTEETLQGHLEMTREKIKALNGLPPNQHFDHPFFGKLNVKPTITFLNIHTRHHLDIINDILKN